MSYTIGRLPYQPVILVTYDPRFFDFWNDPSEVVERLAGIVAKTPEHLYIIHDLHEFDGTFADVVNGLAAAFRARPTSDKVNDSDNIFVGGPDIIRLVSESERQASSNGLEIAHFETMGSALKNVCKGLC